MMVGLIGMNCSLSLLTQQHTVCAGGGSDLEHRDQPRARSGILLAVLWCAAPHKNHLLSC